ncbi:hypothetical protein BDR26DRAFT_1005796 [Obelidium mucronatum]|nr:hypothetical protein BDR26DRAFT_1005796 [Obelidium mucronatum]
MNQVAPVTTGLSILPVNGGPGEEAAIPELDEHPSVTLSDYDLGASSTSLLVPGVQKLKGNDMRRKIAKDSIASLDKNGGHSAFSSMSSVDSSRTSLDSRNHSPQLIKRATNADRVRRMTGDSQVGPPLTQNYTIGDRNAGISPSNSIKSKKSYSKMSSNESVTSNVSLNIPGPRFMDIVRDIQQNHHDSEHPLRETGSLSVGNSPKGSIRSGLSQTSKDQEMEEMKIRARQMQLQIDLLAEQNRLLSLALEKGKSKGKQRRTSQTAKAASLRKGSLGSSNSDFFSSLPKDNTIQTEYATKELFLFYSQSVAANAPDDVVKAVNTEILSPKPSIKKKSTLNSPESTMQEPHMEPHQKSQTITKITPKQTGWSKFTKLFKRQ